MGREQEFIGLDDFQALAACLLEVENFMMFLQKDHDIWLGEFPFDPKTLSLFFGERQAKMKEERNSEST